MAELETVSIIQEISTMTGLSSLAIETGVVLLLMFFIVIAVLGVLTILRIKKEIVKMSSVASSISQLLDRAYKKHYGIRSDQLQKETKIIVLKMLRQGKSYDEILKKVRVSKDYISLIENLAIQKGLLKK
ncbi:MAG: hypothetical protein PVG08_12315 [Desulfobacterales bacterium]|jgi:hypothetical protein